MFCYVGRDEIEPQDSEWAKIGSAPGIYILGKRYDRFYEVLVDPSYLPWLRRHNYRFLDKFYFEACFCYDPTQPTEAEVEVYGVWAAARRFHARFLENAFKAIWSRGSLGLESCLRSIALSTLQIPLEWAILCRDILVNSFLVRL
jgi:hypothetical protein